jgi:hypothetical protein
MAEVDEIRDQALEVARGWSPHDAPESWRLTAALFEAIASNDELLEQLAVLPPDRLPALLASAAIAFLVRRDRPVPLVGYFPEPGGPQPSFDLDFFPEMAAFCSTRVDDIVAVCRDHRYQMNEVARCSQIAVGIAATTATTATTATRARTVTSPIALVDLGTGAGLGLQLDRYRYRIGTREFGPPAAPLTLQCEVRSGNQPPTLELPDIVERIGIELNPIDIEDPAARAWLESCAPPEASALARLAAAIDLARQHPATILAGDVCEVLPSLLDGLARGQRVVVVDAYTAVFLSAERRTLLINILAEAGRLRPITWLSLDPLVPLGPSGRESVQGLALPASLIDEYQQRGVFAVLGALTFDGSIDSGRLLARAHPSGAWVEWLGP